MRFISGTMKPCCVSIKVASILCDGALFLVLLSLVHGGSTSLQAHTDAPANLSLITGAHSSVNLCSTPEVSISFFNDEDSNTEGGTGKPVLQYLTSTGNATGENLIPYQYLLLSCTAPFPIEWVGNAPRHYYYSYILDDESRSVIGNNHESTPFGPVPQLFSVRLHIGNETLARDGFTSVVVACQPAPSKQFQDENIENGQFLNCNSTSPSSGVSVVVRKHYDASRESNSGNQTTLTIQFAQTSHAYKPGKNKTNVINSDFNETYTCRPMIEEEMEVAQHSDSNRNSQILPESATGEAYHSASSIISQVKVNKSEMTAPSGILTCFNGSHSATDLPRKAELPSILSYFYTLPKLCSSENSSLPHLYLGDNLDQTEEEDFLSICVQQGGVISGTGFEQGDVAYVGDNITVTCVSSIYYFAGGMRIKVGPGNDNHQDHDASANATEFSNGPKGYRNMTVVTAVQQVDDENINQTVRCLAPVRKSRRWVTKNVTIKIKVPVRLSFKKTPDSVSYNEKDKSVFLECNASGDPLPELSWSRLNNEKLPAKQTTEIQVSWIVSKLYFPVVGGGNPEENFTSEYFNGRYICTARNKFESMEKVFIFEDKRSSKKSWPLFDESFLLQFDWKALGFWVIVAGSICVLIGVVILLGCKLRKQAKNLRLFSRAEIDDFIFGKPELLLNDSSNYEEINWYAAYLPYDKNRFEIRREQLEFDPKDILGSGAYGTVYKGILKDKHGGQNKHVAIKTVTGCSDKIYFAALLSEIKIMCYIGKHEKANIVELVGACTKYLDQRQIFVATEFCENGDLLSYIRKHSDTFRNNAGREHNRHCTEGKASRKPGSDGYCRLAYARLLLSPHLLLVWALQISDGMVFLSSKKVIHGDLAARNILLASDLKPKIGDFGLSKQLQKYSSYVRMGDDLVPWRWLAIEALQFMKFSIKSDVWAFGVLLYEIFSLGQVPFATYNYTELFLVSLCHGERLQRPRLATPELYTLMLDSWKYSPEDRPSFASISSSLLALIAKSERMLLSGKTIEPPSNPEKHPTRISAVEPDICVNNNTCTSHSEQANDLLKHPVTVTNHQSENYTGIFSPGDKLHSCNNLENSNCESMKQSDEPCTSQVPKGAHATYVDWSAVT